MWVVGTVCANWYTDLSLDISFVFIRNRKKGRRCPCKGKSQKSAVTSQTSTICLEVTKEELVTPFQLPTSGTVAAEVDTINIEKGEGPNNKSEILLNFLHNQLNDVSVS